MDKLSDEQIRLINFLKTREHNEYPKLSIEAFFSKATITSLTNKGLLGDNYSRGVYCLTSTGREELTEPINPN